MDSMPGGPTDNEIIQHVLSGQSRAFEILLERYAPVVFGIVGRHVPQAQVEDVAQEVFIRAYRSLSSYTGQSQFNRWLSKIAVRSCCDYWRSHRAREIPESPE
jgi:RNA polymerase sigma-70 factor, ECF subfamily